MNRKKFASQNVSISTVAAVVIIAVIIIIAAVAAGILLTTSTTPTRSSTTSSATSSTTSSASSSISSSTTTSGTGGTIQIVFGSTLSLGGQFQPFGVEENWTINYIVNYINSIGGIPLKNGTHAMIKFIALNDNSDPGTATTNLQTLVSTDHATVIIGELGGVQDSVAQTFASQNQIPYIGPVYISSYKSCTTNCSNSWIFAPF